MAKEKLSKTRGGARKGAGQKQYVPTRADKRRVTQYVIAGFKRDQIAARLSISEDTLVKHFKEALECADKDMTSEIANNLAVRAKKGSETASIFYLKCRGGWREQNSLTLDGTVNIVKRVIGVDEKDV